MSRIFLKPCPHCGDLVPTLHRPKLCDSCRHALQAEKMRVARAMRQVVPSDLTAEQIEARLAFNDAEIRRTRPFTVDPGWSSPLVRCR